MTDFDIDFINETKPTVDYQTAALADVEDCIDKFTERFQQEHGLKTQQGDDIGGLIVYSRKGKLAAVYDYENFWGWVV